jgi:hypothetical protein
VRAFAAEPLGSGGTQLAPFSIARPAPHGSPLEGHLEPAVDRTLWPTLPGWQALDVTFGELVDGEGDVRLWLHPVPAPHLTLLLPDQLL